MSVFLYQNMNIFGSLQDAWTRMEEITDDGHVTTTDLITTFSPEPGTKRWMLGRCFLTQLAKGLLVLNFDGEAVIEFNKIAVALTIFANGRRGEKIKRCFDLYSNNVMTREDMYAYLHTVFSILFLFDVNEPSWSPEELAEEQVANCFNDNDEPEAITYDMFLTHFGMGPRSRKKLVRCKAMTQKNRRCKKKCESKNGYCAVHM